MNLSILDWTLLVSIATNLIFFVIVFKSKSDKFANITYASTFQIINLFALFFNQTNFAIIKIVVVIVIHLWAARLGTYLLIRIFQTRKRFTIWQYL